MFKDPRTKMIVLIGAGVVVALLAGAAGGWLARGSEISSLEDRVARLEESLAEAKSRVTTETVETTTSVEPTGTATTGEPPVVEPEPLTGERETPTGAYDRQPGMVVGVTTSGGTSVLRIDYVQFLTGGEAADAAAAHGDEWPPPNDYYVVNDNPKTREFPIQAGLPVFVVTNNDGTSDAQGHTITLAQWIAALNGPQGAVFKSTIYWVTIANGTITEITAQYVP